MILVSGCLVGQKCRYDGSSAETNEQLRKMVDEGNAIPVCPEQLGGLPTPRPPQEIMGGDGKDVLSGRAKVVNSEGKNVTENFLKGAGDVLVIAEDNNVKKAILKSKSPQCGCKQIYDGTFKGNLKKGSGVCAALLQRHGIIVMNELNYKIEE